MRPLSEAKDDLLGTVSGVAFDVDDTLTRRGRLEPEAFAALWDLHRAGFRLAAVTGRSHAWARVIAAQWPVDVVAAENGATWVRAVPGESRREGTYEDAATRRRHREQLESLQKR